MVIIEETNVSLATDNEQLNLNEKIEKVTKIVHVVGKNNFGIFT